MPRFLSELTADELNRLDRSRSVFFIPVGPLEDHGSHLGMGLDVAEARRLCQLTAERLEKDRPDWVGVILPDLSLGIDSDTTHTALVVRPYVLRDCLVDWCKSLNHRGFVNFVCFSGHLGPRQLTAIEEASMLLRSQGRWQKWGAMALRRLHGLPQLISASSVLVPPHVVRAAPFWPDPVEHGGRRDTSVALSIDQSKVRAFQSLPQIEKNSSWWMRLRQRNRKTLAGYWGDPSQAVIQDGEEILKSAVDQVYPKLRAAWDGVNSRWMFRSWYSILPPNKSFLKAWVLVALFFILVAMWWAASYSVYDV